MDYEERLDYEERREKYVAESNALFMRLLKENPDISLSEIDKEAEKIAKKWRVKHGSHCKTID